MKTKRMYFKEIDDEINNIDMNIFKIGENDFNKKFETLISNLQSSFKEKNTRTKYKINLNELNNKYPSSNEDDILIPIKYEYNSDKHEDSFIKKESSKKIYEKEDTNENRGKKNDVINIDNNNNSMENIDIFGEDKYPMEDEPILEPPT